MLAPIPTHIAPSPQKLGSGETYLLDDTLSSADRVPIVELMLRKVELGYVGSVLDLVDGSLKLGLPNRHE